jgi:hypothetical protein
MASLGKTLTYKQIRKCDPMPRLRVTVWLNGECVGHLTQQELHDLRLQNPNSKIDTL